MLFCPPRGESLRNWSHPLRNFGVEEINTDLQKEYEHLLTVILGNIIILTWKAKPCQVTLIGPSTGETFPWLILDLYLLLYLCRELGFLIVGRFSWVFVDSSSHDLNSRNLWQLFEILSENQESNWQDPWSSLLCFHKIALFSEKSGSSCFVTFWHTFMAHGLNMLWNLVFIAKSGKPLFEMCCLALDPPLSNRHCGALFRACDPS